MNDLIFYSAIALNVIVLFGLWVRVGVPKGKIVGPEGVQPSRPWPRIIHDNDVTVSSVALNPVFFGTWAAVQKEVWQTAEDHGWHDRPLNDGEAIALMHSELSEALEALRHDNPPDDHIPAFSGAEAELADVVIRIMHYAQRKGLRVAEAVIAKAEHNKSRPAMHGGKKF